MIIKTSNPSLGGSFGSSSSPAIQNMCDPRIQEIVQQLEAIYVNVGGDTMYGELKGVDATTPEGFMPSSQITNLIDARIESSPFYNPEFFKDFGLITSEPSDFIDYGLITESVTETIDYGAL